ncbi:hypothetical protein VNI00_017035, partial [Paramarasmius palmivorus]
MSGFMLNPELNRVDVWALESELPSYFKSPTWDNKPARTRLVATFTASPGQRNESPTFPCLAASNYNFEMACSAATPFCHLDLMDVENNQL